MIEQVSDACALMDLFFFFFFARVSVTSRRYAIQYIYIDIHVRDTQTFSSLRERYPRILIRGEMRTIMMDLEEFFRRINSLSNARLVLQY